MRSVDYLARYFEAVGVTHVFGVGGANIEDLFDGIHRSTTKVKCVVAKSEFCAACMACGYSQVTNQLGVVMTTSGGAALNVLPALGEAYASNYSVLAIIGQPVSQAEGKGVFQDTSGLDGAIDGVTLFSCLASKYLNKISNADDLMSSLQAAAEGAISEPQGVSVLLLGKVLQQSSIDNVVIPTEPLSSKEIELQDQDKTNLDVMLSYAKENNLTKFFIIAGSAVLQSSCRAELADLSKKLNANVAVTPNAKSAFDNYDPLFVGVTGVAAHDSVKQRIEQADVVFIIGARLELLSYLDIRDTLAKKYIVYINNQAPYAGFLDTLHNKVEVVANIKQALDYVSEGFDESKISICNDNVNTDLNFLPPISFDAINEFNAYNILNLFSIYIPQDASVFVDAGNTGAAVLHYLPAPSQGYYGIALGMGGMGFAIGAGIGAAFATQKKVFIFMGDGSFLMNGLELHTAIEYNLPVVFVIFNNNSHAMCYTREKLYFKGDYTYNLFKPAHYGKALGVMFPTLKFSDDISSLDSLKNSLETIADIQTPVVLSLNLDPNEFPPFLPLLQAYRQKKE